MFRRIVLCFSIASIFGFMGGIPAKADGFFPAWNTSSEFVWRSPVEAKNWKVGFYEGLYASGRFRTFLYNPSSARLKPEAIVAANGVYSIMTFPWLPLDAELDVVAAGHVGGESAFGEGAIVLAARWKWFPWNNFIYTNLRIGSGGPSYTTKISNFERAETNYFRSAKVLNFMFAEWTLARSENADVEVFARIHHRSGANGKINGVVGGSNYLSVGLRTRL